MSQNGNKTGKISTPRFAFPTTVNLLVGLSPNNSSLLDSAHSFSESNRLGTPGQMKSLSIFPHTPTLSEHQQYLQDPELPKMNEIAIAIQGSCVGKKLPEAFYVHISALSDLGEILQEYERSARKVVPQANAATLVKFSIMEPKISYLFYPSFDTNPHPALQASIQVDLITFVVTHRDYSTYTNTPILHRKETFVNSTYPLYQQFVHLTQAEEALGLLKKTNTIGTRKGWEERLRARNVEIHGHQLIQHETPFPNTRQIERHKAAIIRHDLSRPVRTAVEAGFFTPDTTFFDYGCGHGGDITRISQKGFTSSGWDPYYAPDSPQVSADIVNLGYVINVIEDPSERRQALIKAWELTEKVLIVSAQVSLDGSDRGAKGAIAYGDGIVTVRNTFQKYFEPQELKAYIDHVLGVDAIPAGLGICFVFRDETQAQSFRASRFRSRMTTPRIRVKLKRFENYRELLTPLMDFVTERGRLPKKEELPEAADICGEFITIKRAYDVILQATDPEEWEAIARKRRQDMMVYLALANFERIPKLRDLAPSVQMDIKVLFGSYKQACLEAEEMLYSVGDLESIAQYCQQSQVGKKSANSLLVHISALEHLDPLLRLYEGCASRTIGRMQEANVIKIHTQSPKISYLYYPDFDTDPHPALLTSMTIDLQDLHVSYRDFDPDDPPLLHRKESLVTGEYPRYEKFIRLTRQETDWGLLDDERQIKYRSGWLKCLADNCATLRGHQLLRRPDTDPYRLRVLRAQVRQRRQKLAMEVEPESS